MSDENKPNEQSEQGKPADKPEPKETPWGADFDPERAWTLVSNLREERDRVKASLKAREDAEKSEAEKIADRLAAAEQTAAQARRELLVERAQRKHSLPDEVVEFLTGDTEEEIEAKAARLASLSGKKTESEAEEPGEGEKPSLPAKPKPALTPGHGGESSEEGFDPDAVAKAARRGY